MSNNSPTAAGPTDKNLASPSRSDVIDAINQIFTLFRLNYHNQYLKAFGNTSEVNEVKRLWLDTLGHFDARVLLLAAKSIIETSEYLPTLRTMILHCEQACQGPKIPDAHAAYVEACQAPSPKAGYAWSHPVVYYAGQKADWYFLATQPEKTAFPVFRTLYETLCQQLKTGLVLTPPQAPSVLELPIQPLDKQENSERLKTLKASLGF